MSGNLETKTRKIQDFSGAAVATLTPFDAHGEVNVAPIPEYVQRLKANGVRGLYVHGTTGEGFSMTNAEKLVLARAYKAAIAKYDPTMLFIVNITSTCMKETIELAKALQELDVDALALLPPLYFKVNSPQALVDYIKLVANAVPTLPILYYYIPSFVTENVNIVEALRLGVAQIPSLVGMKYSSSDVITLSHITHNVKNFKVFCGFEDALLPALVSFNCTASVGAVFNLAGYGNIYDSMLKNYKSDIEAARKNQVAISNAVDELKKDGTFFVTLKNHVNEECKKDGSSINFGYTRSPIDSHYSI